jgi:hypothetical protein
MSIRSLDACSSILLYFVRIELMTALSVGAYLFLKVLIVSCSDQRSFAIFIIYAFAIRSPCTVAVIYSDIRVYFLAIIDHFARRTIYSFISTVWSLSILSNVIRAGRTGGNSRLILTIFFQLDRSR